MSVIHCINLRGNVYRALNNSILAATEYNKAQALMQWLKFDGKGRIWKVILKANIHGMIHLDTGDWEKAVTNLRKTPPSLAELPDIAEVFIGVAFALWKLGYVHEALDWYAYGEQLASELGMGQPISREQKRWLENDRCAA